MSRRNIAEEWKLEDGDETNEQWNLQPAEQSAISQWQLQEEGNEPLPRGGWQPVDVARDPGGSSGNWILPALVGVALVAVIAYVAWIALDRAGFFGPVTVEPAAVEPTPASGEPTVEAAAVATEAATPTTAPSPTLNPEPTIPPTPEPSPTPVPLVNLDSIRVSTVGGVNARREPSTDAEVITILPEGDTLYLIGADQGEWMQIALPDGQVAWVSSQFVQRVGETVLLEEANRRRQAVGLAPLVVEGAPPQAPAAVTSTLTTTAPLLAPAAISVTVNVTGGVNAREAPNLNGTVMQLLAGSTSFAALARTADGQWLQIRLPDNRLAWVASQFLTPNGDINTLSTEPFVPGAPNASNALTTTTPITTGAVTTATTPLTTTASTVPTVTQVAGGVSASITSLSGVNARAAPDREAASLQLLSFDSVLPVVGRSADNEWVQVTLAEGQLAWVLANAVSLNADLASLPVVNP